MKQEIGYQHTFQFWHNVNNVAKVNNYLRDKALPQDMQKTPSGLDAQYTHGIAEIGPFTRQAYFDLGGYFNLMDDANYVLLTQLIREGRIPHAQLLTPADLGYSSKGVPIDVAAAAGQTQTSVIYVNKWIAINITVRAKSGRVFKLNQVVLGFVPRKIGRAHV